MENEKVQSDSSKTYDVQEKKKDCIGMLDMHAHLLCLAEEYRGKLTEQEMLALAGQELTSRRANGIDTVFSCGTPQEWEFMRQCLAQSEAAVQIERRTKEQPFDQTAGKIEGRPLGQVTEKTEGRLLERSPGSSTEQSEKRSEERDENFLLSFGIHPWYSDRFDPRDCWEYFEACPIIGEIGMDSVWCEVPLDVQRRAFAQQLELAAELGKPVVLHTKGQERQIAEMIRDFPGKVCVHWYSGSEADFEKFLETDCYFTLGPDLAEKYALQEDTELWSGGTAVSLAGQNEMAHSTALYRRMLREIPAERLFLETDGLSSIAWMCGQGISAVSFGEIREVLGRNMKCLAREKQMRPEQLCVCLQENFHRFTS